MFHKQIEIEPARMAAMMAAADQAARAVPPAFPLDATVAVNPFLGRPGDDLATAAARFGRAAGVALTRPRAEYAAMVADGRITDEDLAAALIASASPVKPVDLAHLKARLAATPAAPVALPTMAEVAAQATGTDWPAVVARCLGQWAAGFFDRGQALWTPASGHSAFAGWREWATHDLTPEIAGLKGFCAHVAACPDTPGRAILRAADRLGLTEATAGSVFERLLADLGGWAQHARYLQWQAELAGGTDSTLTDLLAIRMVWEEALADLLADGAGWDRALQAHAMAVAPTQEQVIDCILQDAAERAFQRGLSGKLASRAAPVALTATRPAMQAAFCIDVRSEVFRRALEGTDARIETLGFAGFFGLPVAHCAAGSDVVEAHLPVLLKPAMTSRGAVDAGADRALRIGARAVRAWGRFRQAAVSSFAFVEAAGPFYAGKLVKDALALGLGHADTPDPAPQLDPAFGPDARVATAQAVLTAMGLTKGFAPLVLLVGHGATTENNPHASAYHCGACGGHTGEVSARLLAGLLNDAGVRTGLAEKGIPVPADTAFVAGLHDTTTDRVRLFPDGAEADLALARRRLEQAGAMARAERAARLPGAMPGTVAARALNWAEVRPEWGLAGCAAFIAAPRSATAGVDLGGRAFLHSYDWREDRGFATLELILTAPVVVASWISLQYYASAVAPSAFGAGNKLIHNAVGGFGVVQGNGGTLCAGLPWQAVHDGAGLAHDPLRLTVMIEAPQEAISGILARHDGVRALFDRGWMHLLALEDGRVAARYRAGGAWVAVA